MGRVAVALVIAGFALPAASAGAATIKVTTTLDKVSSGGGCALRQAVIAANTDTSGPGGDCTAGNGADTIQVPSGDYKLTVAPAGGDDATSGDLNLTAPVTISGAGASATMIEGEATDRVFDVESSGGRLLGLAIENGNAPATLPLGGDVYIAAAGSVDIAGSLVTDGFADNTGGAIDNQGNLTVENSTVSSSRTTAFGGGIGNFGSLSIDSSTITGNGMGSTTNGAGIYSNGSSFEATNTTVSNNSTVSDSGGVGGGLELDTGGTLTGVDVTGNSASLHGAGIYDLGTLTIDGSTLSNNTLASTGTDQMQGGGIYALGQLTVTNSWLHDNNALNSMAGAPQGLGGAIYYAPSSATYLLSVDGSTVGPNDDAAGGDGIDLTSGTAGSATANLTRSTVAGNGADTVSGLGGGVAVGQGVTANLRDVTLAQNKASNSTGGGNLYAATGSTVTWENTLVAQPFGGGNCDLGSPAPSVTTLGGDQEYGDSAQTCGFTNSAHGDVHTSTDLTGSQLHDLAPNGGPTETMALAPGAPPLNTGFGCQPTDQRGAARPQSSACDSGAYELDTTPPSVSITSGPVGAVTDPSVRFSFTADEPATFQCQLDGGGFSACASPFMGGPLPLGPHSFTVVATDIAGNRGTPVSRSFTVAAQPRPPSITALTESAKHWTEGRMRAKTKLPVGTTFSFTLSEPASVRLVFTRLSHGRRVSGRCVAPKHRNRHRPNCRRALLSGSLTVAAHSGANTVKFRGRLSPTRKLRPGHYRVQVIATNEGGQRSVPRSLTFTIADR